jgi:hypothetical protein
VVLGKRELSVILLVVGALLFLFVALATPSEAQTNCPGAQLVNTTTGNGNKQSPVFNIKGTSFRLNVVSTATSADPALAVVDVFVYPQGETVSYVSNFQVNEGNDDASIVNAGPGQFYLNILAANADYAITVEDCTGAGGNGDNNKNKKNNKNNNKNKKNNGGGNNNNHKKHRHHHGRHTPFNNPFRQYARNNGQYNGNNDFNQQSENTSGTNSVTSQQYSGGNTSGAGENTFGGNGGASASSGPGGAEASTPGAVAQSGNPDQQYPVSGPQGNVVNEIPTQGPLPNTGGLSFLTIALPVAGFLLLCVAVIYRVRESLRENR